jgi:hypothetical protein
MTYNEKVKLFSSSDWCKSLQKQFNMSKSEVVRNMCSNEQLFNQWYSMYKMYKK